MTGPLVLCFFFFCFFFFSSVLPANLISDHDAIPKEVISALEKLRSCNEDKSWTVEKSSGNDIIQKMAIYIKHQNHSVRLYEMHKKSGILLANGLDSDYFFARLRYFLS